MRKKCLMVLHIILASVFGLPVIATIACSFMGSSELNEMIVNRGASLHLIPLKATLSGYYELLFAGGTYLGMFWNSLYIATSVAIGNAVVGLIVGYALAKTHFRGRNKLLFIYILVMMMPYQVTLLPNFMIIKKLGIFNTVWALILPGIFSPFGVFMLTQFMRLMPNEVVDAAKMETNSALKVLAYVVAPIAFPGLVALFVMSFADAWNMVEQPLIMLRDTWRYPLSLALNDMHGNDNVIVSFSGAVLYMLPVILLFRLFEEELIQGMSVAKL